VKSVSSLSRDSHTEGLRNQGIASHIKEIVIHSNFVDIEDLGEEPRDQGFEVALGTS
jgi:hypothetical protein